MPNFSAYAAATSIGDDNIFLIQKPPFNVLADTLSVAPALFKPYINSATTVTGNTALAAWGNYISNGGSLLTHTLPATCVAGATIEISGLGAGLFKIAQNAGQTIIMGNVSSTTGVTGAATSTQQYDCFRLKCLVANTTFALYSFQGSPNLT